ncbi:hypothetical protein DPMN_004205 [Dreissena polymorpha]|uniref:Uncharacterized protein n=1 Tax=Dreissena polymorpha TaxID=45954 RepID=A0A9D4MQV9_DREPO|nr:hypothetical protein DPMN_004205 [Dreissena polymorpha]
MPVQERHPYAISITSDSIPDTLNALDNICLSELFMEPSTNQWEASEPRRSLLTNGTVHEAFQQQYLEKCRRASGLALQSLEINSQTPGIISVTILACHPSNTSI